MCTVRRIGVCLVGVVCMLSASYVAAAVLGYAGALDLWGVYGADALTGCKNPCTDYWVTSLVECRDLKPIPEGHKTPNGCRDYECALNSYRYLKCTDSGGTGPDCAHHTVNEWQRWVVAREMPCTDGGYGDTKYGKCAAGGSGLWSVEWTPCQSGGCTGTEVANYAHDMDREVCGPAP